MIGLINNGNLTLRAVFDAVTALGLLDEPELADNLALQAARNVKPTSDHFLAVFVFAANPRADGTRELQIISTTVVGIQQYTTARLRYQGIYLARPSGDSLLMDTLRAHFRAQQEDTVERLNYVGSGIRPPWTNISQMGQPICRVRRSSLSPTPIWRS